VVFQNSDVVPLGPYALERLLEPLLEGRAEASYARQLPRPEAHTWVRRDYDRAFPASGPAPDWLPYSLPLAAMLRRVWKDLPFYDEAWGSEDSQWGYRARRAGLGVEYVPSATVMHSHNYTLRQIYGRRFIEGEADAFIFRQPLTGLAAARGLAGSLASDFVAHVKASDLPGLALSPARRAVYHWAYLKGRRLGERRIRLDDRNTSTGQKVVLERYEG
jgi:rhamnosyltransferase